MPYKDRENYSEQTIQRVLYTYFKDMDYKMSNVYMFGKWESDFFFLTKVKHLWEIEIKVDKQDFDRDFTLKPKKHKLLLDAYEKQDPGKIILPNNFYFCGPENVIPVDSIPEYAGLLEIHGENKDLVRYKKKAPKIHKEVKNVEPILLKKFYNKTLRMEKMLSDFRISLFEDPENQEEIVRKFLKRIRM